MTVEHRRIWTVYLMARRNIFPFFSLRPVSRVLALSVSETTRCSISVKRTVSPLDWCSVDGWQRIRTWRGYGWIPADEAAPDRLTSIYDDSSIWRSERFWYFTSILPVTTWFRRDCGSCNNKLTVNYRTCSASVTAVSFNDALRNGAFYHPRCGLVMRSVASVCLCVRPSRAITFESLDLENSFLACRCIVRISRSNSYIKDFKSTGLVQGHKIKKVKERNQIHTFAGGSPLIKRQFCFFQF